MRKEMTLCPGCSTPFATTAVELSRGHGALRCAWCSELEVIRVRMGMRAGEPISERRFWEEIAKRLAAYASREGAAIALKFEEGTQSTQADENGSNRV